MADLNRNRYRGYPNVIKNLPEADIPSEGIKAWTLQGETHQLVFYQMETNAIIPEHIHEYAEWGMVIEGEIELTVEGKTRNVKKGDEWLTPARAKHKWASLTKSRVIGLFSERARYRTKQPT
jgi:quercetin dioxygenase-like cupin family protein